MAAICINPNQTGDTVDDIGHETRFTHKYRTGLTTMEIEGFKYLDTIYMYSEFWIGFSVFHFFFKVSKGAKIKERYNQVPHLTQDTNGKVTNSQLDTTNESQ